MLLILVPLAFLLVTLQPRKPWLVLIAIMLFVSSFSGPTGGVLWWYGRGWVLILSAWFIVAVALWPASTVLEKALSALAAAFASVALIFAVKRGGWYQLDWAVGGQLRNGAADVVAFWSGRLNDKPWSADLTKAIYNFVDFQAKAYPALVAIASLAALTLAWWLWRRLSVQEPSPLRPLREFKFSDALIWVVILGAALIVLPLEPGATRAGTNLLTFMAALYALRGLAVILALFGTPTLLGALFGVVLFLMMYPVVMATTLMVGLTDTWLDLRGRRLMRQDNEKH